MDTNAYVTFLVIGAVLVVIDGQIIYRSGRRYLENSYGDPEAGASMTRLITVLFHLAVLGLLALLSTIPLGGSSLPGVVGRTGVLLLVLALAHAVTLGVLSRIRDEQVSETLIERKRQQNETLAHGPHYEQQQSTVTPVPGQQQSNFPVVSPALEHGTTYPTDR